MNMNIRYFFTELLMDVWLGWNWEIVKKRGFVFCRKPGIGVQAQFGNAIHPLSLFSRFSLQASQYQYDGTDSTRQLLDMNCVEEEEEETKNFHFSPTMR